jgi:histidinol-phosphate aminotransferase
MSRFWSQVVRDLTPYVPGEQPKIANLIKLNTNENPFPPSPTVLAAIQAELGDDAARLRLYPDPNADLLKAAVAKTHGVTPAQIFLGNGSDEVLAHVFSALLKHERPILFPDITYSFYPVYCGLYGIDYQTIALADDFSINPADYCGRPNGGIIFPNPNAPTGRLLALDAIEQIVAANPDSVVVIDEAYVDFGGESAIKLVDRYANLLVVHTLSKSRSLAGSARWVRGRPSGADRSSGTGQEQLQLLPAGQAGHRWLSCRHGRPALLRAMLPGSHRHAHCID